MKILSRVFPAAALLFVAACGSQTNNPPPDLAVVGPGIITPAQCAAGQILTTIGCLPTDPRCQPTQGFNAANNQCVEAVTAVVPTVQRYGGQLTIVDRRQFEWYLNDSSLVAGSAYPSAFCENYGNVYGSGYPCSYFSSEAGIQILNQGGAGFAVQIAPLRPHPYGLRTPAIPMRLFPTNNNQGFTFQQNSGFSLVQVVGHESFGSVQGIDVDVTYKGVTFGRGVLYPQ